MVHCLHSIFRSLTRRNGTWSSFARLAALLLPVAGMLLASCSTSPEAEPRQEIPTVSIQGDVVGPSIQSKNYQHGPLIVNYIFRGYRNRFFELGNKKLRCWDQYITVRKYTLEICVVGPAVGTLPDFDPRDTNDPEFLSALKSDSNAILDLTGVACLKGRCILGPGGYKINYLEMLTVKLEKGGKLIRMDNAVNELRNWPGNKAFPEDREHEVLEQGPWLKIIDLSQ